MSAAKTIHQAVLVLALGTAVLYSSLLPLWEGFDEPFHFAYVQWLSVTRQWPALDRTFLSHEVWQSLNIAPVSPAVHHNIPETITFDQWFGATHADKQQRQHALRTLPPALRTSFVEDRPNYEAHQAPLAYLLMSVGESMLAFLPLPTRVLAIRLVISLTSVLLLFSAAEMLSGCLGLDGYWKTAAFLCVFQHQMLWATVAHISNDWLAIPAGTALIAAMLTFEKSGTRLNALKIAIFLSAGLLTKAYFLTFAPLAAAMPVWAAISRRCRWRTAFIIVGVPTLLAGFWYARNLSLYGSLSGTQEAASGVGFSAAVSAAQQIDWLETITYMARSSIWTGNNSFLSFSQVTLNIELVLIATGVLLAFKYRIPSLWFILSLIAFCCGLAYVTCTSWVFTGGASAGASPWYAQVLLAPVFILVFSGFSASGRSGRIVAAALVALSTWIYDATYIAKLFPLYSGRLDGPASIRAICDWWLRDTGLRDQSLQSVVLVPTSLLYCLLMLMLLTSAAITTVLLTKFVRVTDSE